MTHAPLRIVVEETLAGSTPKGCPMVAGIYLKANGELPCWCQAGEHKILDTVDREWLERPDSDLLGHPELVQIRQAFSEGRLPYPNLCGRCLALGAGVTEGLRPKRLAKLLVEPSYLCQLDCPACISPKVRLATKDPPYYLDPDLYAAFLDRLRADGVEGVTSVHFEGRGDPMLNRHLGTLLRLTRRAFPEARTQVTTHGGYPFAPWLLDGDLDILQISADGARPESYGRYRRGGDLEKVFGLMRSIRDHRRRQDSRLMVVWKYILFEWNDSDEELALAGRLADELEVRLHWVLTVSAGKSRRFPDPQTLARRRAELAPRSVVQMAVMTVDSEGVDEHYEADFARAESAHLRLLESVRRREIDLWPRHLAAALTLDPGYGPDTVADWVVAALGGDWLAPERVDRLIAEVRFSVTLSALATLAFESRRWGAAARLFAAYLARGPEATDRAHVEGLILQATLRDRLGSDDPAHFFGQPMDILAATDDALLRVDPGRRPAQDWARADDPVDLWLDDLTLPETRRLLGYLRWARGRLDDARELFRSYLDHAPASADTQPVEWALQQLGDRPPTA